MNLKLTKNLIFAVIVAFVTLSLFITFTQQEFVTDVSINLLLYKTSPFPVIYFITGAFLIGLFIGLLVAVLDHLSLSHEIREMRNGQLAINGNQEGDSDNLDILDYSSEENVTEELPGSKIKDNSDDNVKNDILQELSDVKIKDNSDIRTNSE